jgi:hypothetical protein
MAFCGCGELRSEEDKRFSAVPLARALGAGGGLLGLAGIAFQRAREWARAVALAQNLRGLTWVESNRGERCSSRENPEGRSSGAAADLK